MFDNKQVTPHAKTYLLSLNLSYEEPMAILERMIHQLRNKSISTMKILSKQDEQEVTIIKYSI